MKTMVSSTNGWCKISNAFGFLKQATKMWNKVGDGQIKLEWFFLKANESKSHINTLQSQANNKIVIKSGGVDQFMLEWFS